MFASDYRRLARESLDGNWGQAVLTALIAGFLGGSLSSGGSINFNIDLDTFELFELFPADILRFLFIATAGISVIGAVQFLIGGVVQLGYCKFFLKLQDRQNPDIADLFSQFNRLADGLCLRLLISLFTLLWSLLFIIPGIVAAYSYSMAPFIMAEDPECTAQEAIRRSKAMMQGHKLELFTLNISFIGWILLSILSCGVGFFFLEPYTAASQAAFYRSLRANEYVEPL